MSPPPRFAALRNPAYRRYFTVTLVSMTADNIEHVISYWVMFQLFRSPALAGFAVISHWLPFLLFSLHAGALADRYDCRKLIQVSQVLFMLASVAWGALFLADALRMWHAVVILLIHGAAGVVGTPASQLIIHRDGPARRPAECDSAQCEQPLARHPAGTRGGRRSHAAARAGMGTPGECPVLPAPFDPPHANSVHRARST